MSSNIILKHIKLVLVYSNGEGYYCKERHEYYKLSIFKQSIWREILMEVVSTQVKLKADSVKL